MPECRCCGYDTEVKEYKVGPWKVAELCEICASTRLSQAVPGMSPPGTLTQGEIYVMRSMGYIANMLLDEIRQKELDTPDAP